MPRRSVEVEGQWYTGDDGLRRRVIYRLLPEQRARLFERGRREWRASKADRLARMRARGPLGIMAVRAVRRLRRDTGWGIS